MHKSFTFAVFDITLGVMSSAAAAQTPEGVEPGAWAKVEAQLEARGVRPAGAKADRGGLVEVAKLLPTPDITGEEAYFGQAIAVDGDFLVVGANDDERRIGAGAAFIFQRDEGGTDAWGQVAKLMASDGASNDDFGISVSINGDTIVVGARYSGGYGSMYGAAYIFGRDYGGADAWGQAAKINASDGEDGADFGRSVSIEGDTVVIGAPDNTNENGLWAGSAYIFERNEGGPDAWGQVSKLIASDGAWGEEFGLSVSISGDTVVAGAWGDDGNGLDIGSAYIFDRHQGGVDDWGQVAKITASDGANSDYFGYSVSAAGDTVVVGAWGDDENGPDSGSAYIIGRNHGGADTWGQIAKQVEPGWPVADDGSFGFSVSVSGDIVVVGAWGSSNYPNKTGSAFIFGRNQDAVGAWGQIAQLTASDGSAGDMFGQSVSIDGDSVVVGAWGKDDNGTDSGSAYIFGRNQGGADAWGQVAKIMASDGAEEDFFGRSVSISGDSVIVGAYGDSDNGDFAGSAYIYGRNQGGADSWGQVTKITAADGAENDRFGCSTSISGDTVVVGAMGDDSIGSAYIFGREQGGKDAWGQAAKLTPSDGGTWDWFGESVLISRDTVIVGAFAWHSGRPGSAYFFGRNQGGTGAWGQMTKLTASDGAVGDDFGVSVSISGDTVVVGAYRDDAIDTNSGSAYVFGLENAIFADGFETGDTTLWSWTWP